MLRSFPFNRPVDWLILILLFLALPTPAGAENVSWTHNAGGLFSNLRTWIAGPNSVNRVPTAADGLSFLWPDIAVTVDGAQASRSVVVSVPLTLLVQGSYAITELFAQTGISFTGDGTVSMGIAKSL